MDANDSPPARLGRFVEPFASVAEVAASDGEPHWMLGIRKAGLARFAEQGLPTLRHEDWRFTNLAPIEALPFRPLPRPQARAVSVADLDRLSLAGMSGLRLVFVDGHFAPELSRIEAVEDKVQVRGLSQTLRADGAWLEQQLACWHEGQDRAFRALNDAYCTDGIVLHVSAGVAVAEPIHALFLSSGIEPGLASHPRNVLVAEANSRVMVIEQYASLGGAATFTNTLTQLVVGEGAQVEHVRFQDEGPEAFHMGALRAVVAGSAQLAAHSFALGARLSRQNIGLTLAGPGLEAILNGLYVTTEKRLADHHMVVDHAQPHCASHEYFNGSLSGQSRGVFHGRILVRPDAQKTDAKQTNKNLLLSNSASVNTKPQLEIYADDVKCSHGATIGQLNPESVFYLRTRGLPVETARRMLIHAFAGEIIDRVQCGPVRQALDRLVWDRLERDAQVRLDAAAPHS